MGFWVVVFFKHSQSAWHSTQISYRYPECCPDVAFVRAASAVWPRRAQKDIESAFALRSSSKEQSEAKKEKEEGKKRKEHLVLPTACRDVCGGYYCLSG